MKVLIYGLGLHGAGLERARYFLLHKHQVRITDTRKREELGSGVDYLESLGAEISVGGLKVDDFVWADLVIKAQSVKLENEYLLQAQKVTNDFSYVFSSSLLKNVKLVIVTGNNKTVIASSICHCINSSGKTARRCGSMGTSPLTELVRIENGNFPDYLVVEMSIWQLRDTAYFMNGVYPHSEVVVISDSTEISNIISAFDREISDSVICSRKTKETVIKDFGLKPKNITEAEHWLSRVPVGAVAGMEYTYGALRKLGFSDSETASSIKSFKGIPGRVELIARSGNTMYYNDSSATIPDAVEFSIKNFEGCPVHIICGGGDALADSLPMIASLSKCASVHLLSGIFTEKCLLPAINKSDIRYYGPFDDMAGAIESVSSLLNKGSAAMEVVLYSPGCNCFDPSERDVEIEFELAVNKSLEDFN